MMLLLKRQFLKEYRWKNVKYWLVDLIVSNGSKKETRGSHGPLSEEKAIYKAHKLLLEGTKIIDYCLFNPTVENAWIDQKAQKFFGPLKKTA